MARGATAYVTLEPCAHHGKTPPCAEGLIAAGIARVVVAHGDPDPRVSGRGIAMLRAAGIEVVEGIGQTEAARDLQGFLNKVTLGRPMVTLKLASSFDGRIATGSGESQWITGPAARRMVHMQRASHDAVMVGGGTARADLPALTVRDLGVTRQPVRVVLSRHLDLPVEGPLTNTAEAPVWLVHGEGAAAERQQVWRDLGAKLVPVALGPDRRVEPAAALRAMAERGLTRVFCEGGGALAASLLMADLVDRLVGFTAGMAIGAEGRPVFGAMGLDALAEAPRFDLESVQQVGPDLMHIWRRNRD